MKKEDEGRKRTHKGEENKIPMCPFAWHEEVLKWISDSKGGEGSAGVISTHLELLNDFIHTVAMPAIDLRYRFEEMRKKYPVRYESTSTLGDRQITSGFDERLGWLAKHKEFQDTGIVR